MPTTKTNVKKNSAAMPFAELFSIRSRYKYFSLLFLLTGISLLAQSQRQPVINLHSGNKTAETNFQSEKLKTHFRKAGFGGKVYTIVQFDKLPDEKQKERLDKAGIKLLVYIPDNAWWASISERTVLGSLASLNIRGIYEPQTADKLSSPLYNTWIDATAKKTVTEVNVNITCIGQDDKEVIKKQLREAGAVILNAAYESQNIYQAKINAADIEKITALPFVTYINKAVDKSTSLLYITNATHNIYALTSTLGAGRGLSGNNVTVGMGDEGNSSGHIDMADRTINRNPNYYANHSTAVAGILSGAGNLYETYKGVASKVRVINHYFENIITNSPDYMTDYNMTITNNSYYTGLAGCEGDGAYDELSYYIDSQARAHDQLFHVFAAGNDGSLTCSPYPQAYATIKSGWQCAKNVLSVANGIGNAQTITIGTRSSRGPVSDGRIKPEISAAGNDVRTTFPINTYNRAFGTSFASPAVAGVSALLTERYRQLNGNATPKSALLKALLCNSADDLGNPGPDFTFGFGWMNAKKAVEDMEAGHYIISNISTGSTNTHNITVPANTAKLKVMLYWNDAPANPSSTTFLVNDLDLVVNDGSTNYQPWVLNPSTSGVTQNATRNADHLNNIEQVTIDAPTAGSYTISVNGNVVPQGPQEYVLTYEFISTGIELEYPNGGEKFLTDSTETFYWNASDGGTGPLKLEYSSNNGSSWTLLTDTVLYNNYYRWNYAGLTPTNQALVRITRISSGLSDQSDNNFTVLGIPTALSTAVMCDGYVRLGWNAVSGATDYEIFKKVGGEMVSIGTTSSTSFDIDGLSSSQTYWFAVRGRFNGTPGRRGVAKSVMPASGSCSLSNFDNDLKLSAIVSPSTGRAFTSTALGVSQTVSVTIKNLDNAVSSNTYTVSYRVNGGSVVTETPGNTINSLQSFTYTFITPYDFSTVGSYTIEAWVSQSGDVRNSNDTATKSIKQLQNDPVTLPFAEGFETATAASYTTNTTGLSGLDRCDFNGSSSNSRASTFVSSSFPNSGTRSVTLDAALNISATTQSDLITTVNLSNYASTDGLRLTLYYRDHQQSSSSHNYIWIRGTDTQPWVQAYNLNQSTITDGSYIYIRYININEILNNAGQTVSSSFQIKFGEEGITSANNTSYSSASPDLDDGYTFDDVLISVANNDLLMEQITYPSNFNCGLTNATSITVSVKNTSTSTLTNIPVSYRINGGSIVTESIGSIGANSTISYTFATTADLSIPATYTIDTWIKHPSDDFSANDSITNYSAVNNYTVSTFPYSEGFENSSGYWYSQPHFNSWQWGTPTTSKSIITKAANGTKAWITNLDGNYKNNELSYLYSPCFNLSGMTQPVLSFSHIFRTEDDCDCDFHWVEYSTDGITWNKLGAAGDGTNWYDNPIYNVWQISRTYWIVSSVDIPTTNSAVRFRFVFYSDPYVNYDGVGIDDIQVFDKASIYTGPENPKEVIQNVSGNNWVNFDYNGYRIASINPRGQDLGSTSVKVFINDSTPVRYRNNQYYLDRNLVIKPTNTLDSAVLVRFYFTDMESDFLINAGDCPSCSKPASAYDLGVTKYSYAPEENGSLDDNLHSGYTYIKPANTDIIPYDNGYYAEFSVSSFSEFWLNNGGPGQNKPLPLQLLNFNARKENNTTVVDWITAAEINIDKFVIERKTSGGFETIGEVPARGSNSISTHYTFTDNHPEKGNNYYRLHIIEKTGPAGYSPIRNVDFSAKTDLSVYPNPVSSGKVTVQSGEIMELISVSDAKGTLIAQYPVNSKTYILNTHSLAKGIYWLRIQTQKETITQKLICQ